MLVGNNGALYVILQDQSTCYVDITCSKSSSYQGTLYLAINNEEQKIGNCNSYITGVQQVDSNCISKKYTTDLTTLTSYNVLLYRIPVYCRISEDASKYAILDLIRLCEFQNLYYKYK